MQNALTIPIRTRHLSYFSYIGSGGIDISVVTVTFEMLTMLTVLGQQHSFSTHERMVGIDELGNTFNHSCIYQMFPVCVINTINTISYVIALTLKLLYALWH